MFQKKKRIFADILLKEVIEKAKNSNPVTKEVESKRIQTRLFTCAQECARLVCGKDRRGGLVRCGAMEREVAEPRIAWFCLVSLSNLTKATHIIKIQKSILICVTSVLPICSIGNKKRFWVCLLAFLKSAGLNV